MPKYDEERVFMNTRIRITVFSEAGTVYTREKIDLAYLQFADVVDKYTRFTVTSELSKLNSLNGKWQKISPEMFALIEFMLELAEITDGAYDPTIIDLLEAYGYDNNDNFAKLDNPKLYEEIQGIMQTRNSFREIELDKKNFRIKLQPRQRLDLGSIGKGYAVDRAFAQLNEFPSFIINAGGDIRAKGLNDAGKPWNIALYKTQLPNKRLSDELFLGFAELKNDQMSISSSGGWARKVGFFHHLLNTRTGIPENANAQSYVIGKTALLTDAWATILFLMGASALPLLEQKGLEGLVLSAHGKISKSSGFHFQQNPESNK